MPSLALDPDLVALPDASHALRQQYGEAPEYNALWRLLRGGIVEPQRRGARLYVRRADLPRIAALLGLTRPDVA